MNENLSLDDPSVKLCVELISRHPVHNMGEAQLITSICRDVRIAFEPGGAAERSENITTQDSANSAAVCLDQIRMHTALNTGEVDLLEVIANDIKLAFGLEGAVGRASLARSSAAPADWFWQ